MWLIHVDPDDILKVEKKSLYTFILGSLKAVSIREIIHSTITAIFNKPFWAYIVFAFWIIIYNFNVYLFLKYIFIY